MYIWIYVHIHFQSIIFPNIQLHIHIHIYNVHIVQLYHIAYVVTITFCFKTSTLGRIHPALLMQTMIFFSNFKACLEEKRGRCGSPVLFFLRGGYFVGMIFRCHTWRSTKTWRCMHFWMNKKELLQCGIEAMMWQQNGNLYDLNHLPKSKT